jgi:hypothetical protein
VTTKKKPKPKLPTCPLCRSKIINVSIDSGNRLKVDAGALTGLITGPRKMRATCANGCEIVVRAAPKPTDFLALPKPVKKQARLRAGR